MVVWIWALKLETVNTICRLKMVPQAGEAALRCRCQEIFRTLYADDFLTFSPCLLKCSHISWFDFDITSKLNVTSSDNRGANVYCVTECEIEFETIFQFEKICFGVFCFDY